ncbi:MAG: hypothetical protein JO020_11640 [Chloroflexi bacterium]|nr:hypothetical protein [Chloroflexota bacterium]
MPRARVRQSDPTPAPQRGPGQVEERPALEARLAHLDRGQLQLLLQHLAARQPALAEVLDELITALRDPSTPSPAAGRSATHQRRTTTVAATSIRRQVRGILHSLDRLRASEAYWYVGGVAESVRELADQARPHLEAGDGRSALAILEVITDEYVQGWTELDDSDGELGAVFDNLGALWAEAILTADLTPAERQTWAERLADWQAETADYGIETAFDAAQLAAVQGWDDAELQRMLRGEAASPQSEGAWAEPTLALARLNVLERQGRLEEALHLADATRQVDRYVALLVRLGRLAEARRYGLEQLTQAHEALVLARVLLEHGAAQDALQIAEHGLTLAGEVWTLARWLRDTAAAAGDADRATRGALVALQASHALDDYQALQTVAGDRWPTVRDEVLPELRRAAARSPSGIGEIFVHEGLLDDAIAVADSAPYDYAMVEQVADAAIQTHPEWVIRMGRQQAERIMDAGQSRYYHHALAWLKRSRAAALGAGRQDDWRQYLDSLLVRHARKYSLVPQLKQLRA